MDAERDVTRIVRAWLQTDEYESADRILDDVLSRLDATPQRRSWWPAPGAETDRLARLAIAVAAVVVVAVVGINLLPGRGGIGPAGTQSPPPLSASPTPSPTLSPSRSLRPESSLRIGAFPEPGQLATGRHAFNLNGIPFSLAFAESGWASSGIVVPPDGGNFMKADATPQRTWLLVWSIDGVFADPCNHVPAAPVSPSAADLAAAVAGIPGFDVLTPPEDVTLGGRAAKHVQVKLRDDIGCVPSEFFMWYDDVRCDRDDPCHRWAIAPGRQVNDIWIVEVDGAHIWIEAETFDNAAPGTLEEVQQIIASIEFE